MKLIKIFFFMLCVFSTALSYYSTGLSISESDNNDALMFNPAGLAIDHGGQFDFYAIQNKDTDQRNFSLSYKTKGFGVGYENNNSKNYFRVGFSEKIFKNLYAGVVYKNKLNIVDAGLLYRPFDFVSFGVKTSAVNNDYESFDFSLAVRPTGCKFLTLGFDHQYDSDFESLNTSLFLKTNPLKGLELSAMVSSNQYEDYGMPIFDFEKLDEHNLKINLGVNTDKMKQMFSNSEDGTQMYGIAFNSHKQSDFFVFEDDENQYVSIVLNDTFIEEKPEEKFSVSNFISPKKPGTQLRTWIDNINKLAKNPKIDGMIINLKKVSASFSKRQEIRDALQNFKDAGKYIVLYSEKTISNIDYHLASVADEIYVNPLTGVDLKGLKMEVTFYRGLLDSLNVKPHVWRIENKDGKSYKTAGDPFLNTQMSDEMRENYTVFLDDLYDIFTTDIANGRNWLNDDGTPDVEYAMQVIDEGPYWASEIAMERGLIDGVFYPDEFNSYAKDSLIKKSQKLRFKNFHDEKTYDYSWSEKNNPKIAMIYAVGGIVSGKSSTGPQGSTTMGDKTIMNAIKSARNDKSIDAIVLRIDSGGGSALASDQMWREIYKTTSDSLNNKPFIASMSGAAASGGYYIACQADTIVAQPSTVTGSIGVLSIGLNFSELYKNIGINKEVIKRGEFSDFLTQSREFSEQENEKMFESTKYFYKEFKDRVLDGRESLSSEQLEKLALGRIWSGKTASENGLVDVIGGIHKSIEIAKSMAGLEGKDVDIIEYPQTDIKPSFSKDNKDDQLQSKLIFDLLPENLQKELHRLNIIPLLYDEEIYFMMPHSIEIN